MLKLSSLPPPLPPLLPPPPRQLVIDQRPRASRDHTFNRGWLHESGDPQKPHELESVIWLCAPTSFVGKECMDRCQRNSLTFPGTRTFHKLFHEPSSAAEVEEPSLWSKHDYWRSNYNYEIYKYRQCAIQLYLWSNSCCVSNCCLLLCYTAILEKLPQCALCIAA